MTETGEQLAIAAAGFLGKSDGTIEAAGMITENEDKA